MINQNYTISIRLRTYSSFKALTAGKVSMLGNCPNLVWDSLYVRFAAVFNQERCSLSGSTVYPGARFGVSLKLLYPETDLLAESFCCRSC